jgi:hypothetical protein
MLQKIYKLLLGLLVVYLLIWSCKSSKITGPTIPSVDLNTLLSAPEQIQISEKIYFLETFLWRDFQPQCPPDGEPLIASIWIIVKDSLDLPSSLDANRLWVIKDKKWVWETNFSNEQTIPWPYKLEKVARNGPKWGPGIYVDVVVMVIDKNDNKKYLLRASNQYIYRTE